MDRLRSMEVFVAAVDHGSLGAAAEALGMSGPMAGKHVRALEERLGTQLLARTTRRQSLTEFGRRYCDQCRQILEQVGAAERGAEMLRQEPRGTLRVSAPVNYGSMLLSPILAEFLDLHPQLKAELVLDDRFVDLVEEGFDLAVRVGPLADSSLVARRLSDYGLMICASPDYLARRGTPRHPRDLARHQLLGFSHWSSRGGWRLGRNRPDAEAGDEPVSRLVSNNGQALRAAALQGFGLVLQPAVLLAADVAEGKLVEVLADHLPRPAPVHAVYLRSRQILPKLGRFVDFVRARLRPT